MAVTRLTSVYHKLEKKKIVGEYQKILNEWQSMGVIERVGAYEEIGRSCTIF